MGAKLTGAPKEAFAIRSHRVLNESIGRTPWSGDSPRRAPDSEEDRALKRWATIDHLLLSRSFVER